MHTALRLERMLRPSEATVTIADPCSYMTCHPLLAEAAAGNLEPRHVVVPLHGVLRRTQVIKAAVGSVDHERRVAYLTAGDGAETSRQDMRWILVEAADRILPEVSTALAGYTTALLRRRRIEVRLETRLASAEGGRILLDDGEEFPAGTLVWTAGVAPSPLTSRLAGNIAAVLRGREPHPAIKYWKHGSRFDLATGRALSRPATKPDDVYPVRIDGDDAFVRLDASGSLP
jgi:NADH dehydrogenase FAD-containing subunit